MKAYTDLVNYVLKHGKRKPNRTGVDTLSVFNYNYSIDLSYGLREGFPLLTTKKISWKNIVVENLWFLSGKKEVEFLHKHGVRFWDKWVNVFEEVPSAYGFYWRIFDYYFHNVDQVKQVIKNLKDDPFSRRHVISAWSPLNALYSDLPPCHFIMVFNVQIDVRGTKRLNLHLTQRSADVAIGVPYNIAGYAFLLHLFARLTNLSVGTFAHSIVDAHVYFDHIEGLEEQVKRTPNYPPKLTIDSDIRSLEDVEALFDESTETILNTFKLTDYYPHPAIEFEVAV